VQLSLLGLEVVGHLPSGVIGGGDGHTAILAPVDTLATVAHRNECRERIAGLGEILDAPVDGGDQIALDLLLLSDVTQVIHLGTQRGGEAVDHALAGGDGLLTAFGGEFGSRFDQQLGLHVDLGGVATIGTGDEVFQGDVLRTRHVLALLEKGW
jgi:hypothetical protein